MKSVLEKICKENQNKLFKSNKFFFPEKRGSYDIIWKKIL